jgi:hypothetical protein
VWLQPAAADVLARIEQEHRPVLDAPLLEIFYPGAIYGRKSTNVSGGFRTSIEAICLGSRNIRGRWRRWEWGARDVGVAGSNPVTPTIDIRRW